MLLGVQERVLLTNLLPPQGDILTLKLVRELREALSFSEEEIEKFEIKASEGRINWAPTTEESEIAIGDTMKSIVVANLKKLDEGKQLTDGHLSLCEKFGVE